MGCRYVIFDPNDLGFQPDDIQGVNGVTISYVNIPSNGETELVVKPVLNSDNDTFVSGTLLENYKVTYAGVTQVVSNITEVDGVSVTLTVPSLIYYFPFLEIISSLLINESMVLIKFLY